MEDVRDVIQFGNDLGNTFLLTGLVSAAVWLQFQVPAVAAVFLIAGAFIVVYTKAIKKKMLKDEPEKPTPSVVV